MPELPFPDLVTPVARATEAPPFEQIVGRARRRRRRHVLGAAAGTAALVASAATGVVLSTGHENSAPGPAQPSVSRGSTATPVAVDAARIVLTGGLLSYAAGPDGSLLTVWKACAADDETDCDTAWQLQTRGDVYQGIAKGDTPSVYAGSGGFVLDSWNRRAVVIDAAQGQTRQVTPAASRTVGAGDVFIGEKGHLVVVDPRTATSWPLATAPDRDSWVQAAVGADGSIWAMTLRNNDVPTIWSLSASAGSAWRQHVMASTDTHDSVPGYFATSGDHIAALSGYDGATVLPVADLAVTTDGGRTWTDLHQSDLPFKYVDAMAATSGGTLYVVTPAGQHLYRSTDDTWTRFTEVPNPSHADSLVPAGDHVLARGGTFEAPVLEALDDAGRSAPVPLTG
jgi:hypothetical protein